MIIISLHATCKVEHRRRHDVTICHCERWKCSSAAQLETDGGAIPANLSTELMIAVVGPAGGRAGSGGAQEQSCVFRMVGAGPHTRRRVHAGPAALGRAAAARCGGVRSCGTAVDGATAVSRHSAGLRCRCSAGLVDAGRRVAVDGTIWWRHVGPTGREARGLDCDVV